MSAAQTLGILGRNAKPAAADLARVTLHDQDRDVRIVAAIGLVRNFWHYATDTIGAMLLATVVVLGAAFIIDTYGATVMRRLRPATDRQLTRPG